MHLLPTQRRLPQMAWRLNITLIADDQIHEEVLITSTKIQTSCKTSCCCKASPAPIRRLHSITFMSIAQNTGAAQIWRWTTDRLGRHRTASASIPASRQNMTETVLTLTVSFEWCDGLVCGPRQGWPASEVKRNLIYSVRKSITRCPCPKGLGRGAPAGILGQQERAALPATCTERAQLQHHVR
eukprot:3500-Heterococcus_DN1.PRE.2